MDWNSDYPTDCGCPIRTSRNATTIAWFFIDGVDREKG